MFRRIIVQLVFSAPEGQLGGDGKQRQGSYDTECFVSAGSILSAGKETLGGIFRVYSPLPKCLFRICQKVYPRHCRLGTLVWQRLNRFSVLSCPGFCPGSLL